MDFPPFNPLTPQSSSVPFSDWLSLLTLCLAPIIAHIAAGVPQPTYLTHPRDHDRIGRPKWHDLIAHYNPASIIWRYAALTDRRIRTPPGTWSPADMAAANALFWTGSGWDGSEQMAEQVARYAIRLPERGFTSVLSWEFLKTVVVVLQGVQVVYLSAAGFAGQVRLPSVAVDTVSFPIALLGLLRLWPAFWVTDDYAYVVGAGDGKVVRGDNQGVVNTGEGNVLLSATERGGLVEADKGFRLKKDSWRLLETPTLASPNRFLPPSYWPSRLFRFVYVVPLVMLWPIALLTLVPGPWHRTGNLSMTAYFGALLSTVNLAVITVIYSYYSARHGCKSTIIPCASATWYKALTVVFWAAALALLVVSAVETRRTPCGRYTTAREHMDSYYCPGLMNLRAEDIVFGVARWVDGTEGSIGRERKEFEVVNFIGSCQGVIGQSRGFYNVSVQ